MLKILSVNIEYDRHIDKVQKLIDDLDPDIICLQEVMKEDVPVFAKQINGEYYFSTMNFEESSEFIDGIAIISKHKITRTSEDYYYKNKVRSRTRLGKHIQGSMMVLLGAEIEKDGEHFNILNTHFLKTSIEGGFPDEFQFTEIKSLINSLSKHKEFILCGDFNAPRGMEIFTTLAEKYKDNIDPKYTSSLDPVLHRRPDLELMVDGLFTTPEYKVTEMYFQDGVSDHFAIVAEVLKVSQETPICAIDK